MGCLECGKTVTQKRPGRTKLFCSRKCFRANYRKRPSTKDKLAKSKGCPICSSSFVPTKRHQQFCSRLCYTRAWQLDREKYNEKSRNRRQAQPDWYREHEPRYYKTYRIKETKEKPWLYLLKSRRSHAKYKNLAFDLTDEWANSRWTGRCEITGIEFRKNETNGPHPFSPSLDRIDSCLGYTQSNCRFVLWGCNAIKGVGTDTDMLEIASAIVKSWITDQIRP
jgi:endogenous inhibitor of DNA gyrase (YacG/DUF329 family)